MKNLKETFMRKYGIWEYLIFVLGIITLYKVAEWTITTDYEDYSWEVIAFVFLSAAFGVVLLAAPFTILEWARKKIGVTTRKEKLEGKPE